MTYVFSAGLQSALYQRLVSSPGLITLIGGAVYDAPLQISGDQSFPDHITLGEEFVRPAGTKTSEGAIHDFTVTVHSGRDGFDTVKRIAAEVCAALLDEPLVAQFGQIVAVRFLRAKAERGPAPEKRKVSLLFRAIVDQDH